MKTGFILFILACVFPLSAFCADQHWKKLVQVCAWQLVSSHPLAHERSYQDAVAIIRDSVFDLARKSRSLTVPLNPEAFLSVPTVENPATLIYEGEFLLLVQQMSAKEWLTIFESRTQLTPPPKDVVAIARPIGGLDPFWVGIFPEEIHEKSFFKTLDWAAEVERTIYDANRGRGLTGFFSGLRTYITNVVLGRLRYDVNYFDIVKIARKLPIDYRKDLLHAYLTEALRRLEIEASSRYPTRFRLESALFRVLHQTLAAVDDYTIRFPLFRYPEKTDSRVDPLAEDVIYPEHSRDLFLETIEELYVDFARSFFIGSDGDANINSFFNLVLDFYTERDGMGRLTFSEIPLGRGEDLRGMQVAKGLAELVSLAFQKQKISEKQVRLLATRMTNIGLMLQGKKEGPKRTGPGNDLVQRFLDAFPSPSNRVNPVAITHAALGLDFEHFGGEVRKLIRED